MTRSIDGGKVKDPVKIAPKARETPQKKTSKIIIHKMQDAILDHIMLRLPFFDAIAARIVLFSMSSKIQNTVIKTAKIASAINIISCEFTRKSAIVVPELLCIVAKV
jgi:hypothetical protein